MSPKAICPACDSVSGDKTDAEAEESVTDHNQRMHDEEVALVMPDSMSTDDLNELMDHAKEVCNGYQYEKFVGTVVNDWDYFGARDDER